MKQKSKELFTHEVKVLTSKNIDGSNAVVMSFSKGNTKAITDIRVAYEILTMNLKGIEYPLQESSDHNDSVNLVAYPVKGMIVIDDMYRRIGTHQVIPGTIGRAKFSMKIKDNKIRTEILQFTVWKNPDPVFTS